ncbi:hypothetical protein J2T57_003575 [Natronocella acetinitrilica]|uniref:Uncharacterized protein n=1 Tax=Natronocella acetinitrilica TaxID=414046 RepID=A0AAE3KD39_9GAMM|nr:hypothetical protein [Natronocella acetinitrilica]MCP1676414.1 hypothetical protein [Natronocella acetinitrilica]
MVQRATGFEARLVDGARDAAALCSEVWLSGQPFGGQLEGAVLEAAVQADSGMYLLFLTDDVPHEDFLHVHLLSAEGDLLDSASLGYPYATGTFSLLELEPPDRIRFGFFGETDWIVELLPRPELCLPLIAEPRGVRRALRLRRHFRIHGDPRRAGRS